MVKAPGCDGNALTDGSLGAQSLASFTPSPSVSQTVTETEFETALRHSPLAVAFAVIASLATKAVINVFVQVFSALTVVVPTEISLTNTSITVPAASILVPLIDVAPEQIGELTTGASEIFLTVGNVAVLLVVGTIVQLGVTSVRVTAVTVNVCPLFAAFNAIVLKVATPEAFEVTATVCVAPPPM